MDGDGIFTLIMGIAATAALFGVLNRGFMGGKPKLMMYLSNVAVIAGVLGALAGINGIISVRSHSAEFFGKTIRPEVAWGVWLVVISSVTLLATATIVYYQARKESKQARKESEPPPPLDLSTENAIGTDELIEQLNPIGNIKCSKCEKSQAVATTTTKWVCKHCRQNLNR